MIRGDGEQQRLVEQQQTGEIRVLRGRRRIEQAAVDLAPAQCFLLECRTQGLKFDANLRPRQPELPQRRRQDIGVYRALHITDGERARLAAPDTPRPRLDPIGLRQQGLRLGQEPPPLAGQADAFLGALDRKSVV